MPVNWECSKCAAYKVARSIAEKNGEFDSKTEEWIEFADLREALIWALLVVKFPPKSVWAITEQNWQTIYKRLYMLEKVGGAYRSYMNKDDVYFSPEEIHSMIGFRVNAGSMSDAEYKKYIYTVLSRDAETNLVSYERKSKEAA